MIIYKYPIFWKVRALRKYVSFGAGVTKFRHELILNDIKSGAIGLRHLFKMTQIQLLLSFSFAVLLHVINPVVLEFYDFEIFKIPNDTDYVPFLATISGIGGVFIGLYYAAVSSIAGSIYAKVPNDIRSLLAQERVGYIYMNLLSFMTFLGLSLVSFRVLGFERVQVAIPVMLIAGGIGIISFVKLGQRVFYLFDPTALSKQLFDQLRKTVAMVMVGGHRWNDPDFQNHANRLASSSLDTLTTLADITRREVHLRGEPYIDLSKSLMSFLMLYEGSKNKIPSNSQWYAKRYVHRDWYRTSDSRVSMAHQTGTSLKPETTNDKEWVEARVLVVVRGCIEVNLMDERYNEVLGLAGYVDAYLKKLAKTGRASRAFEILEDFAASVLRVISPDSVDEEVTNEVVEKLALIEWLASVPISLSLACQEWIDAFDADLVGVGLSQLTWAKDAEIYKKDFPCHYLPTLEWLASRLDFELSTEGEKITPFWYVKELLLKEEAKAFVENTGSLIERGTKFYKACLAKTVESKHPWLTGAVMSREWEYWHKIENQMREWPTKWSELSGGKKIEGLPWSDFEKEGLEQLGKNRKIVLLKLMSQHSLRLDLLEKPEGFPDYSGQFLHASGESSLEALLSNDFNLLENIFKMYLLGCITRFEKLRPQSVKEDWRVQQEFKVSVAPLLDLMEISGYAKLMSDYYDDDQLWKFVSNSWDEYLSCLRNSPLPLLVGAIGITDGAFEIPHRGILRTNWKMRIRQRLSDVRRKESHRDYLIGAHSEVIHDSALVRMFARDPHGGFYDGIDIFICFYLRGRDGADGLDFGSRRLNFQDSYDREVARSNNVKCEEDS